MWEWSRAFAERGAATAWTRRDGVEPRPTITDPQPWTEHAGSARADEDDPPAMAESGEIARDAGGYVLAG